MKQKPSAFSKDNLLFTIPWLICLGAIAFYIAWLSYMFLDTYWLSGTGPLWFMGIYTGIHTNGAWDLRPETIVYMFHLLVLPAWLIFLAVLHFKTPRKWVKPAIVLTSSEMVLAWAIAAVVNSNSLRAEWGIQFNWTWESILFVVITPLILTPMILHLIRTRKKPILESAGD